MGSVRAFVKWFDDDLGIGMLIGPDREEVLYHRHADRSSVSEIESLISGDIVECQIVQTENGYLAMAVCVLASAADNIAPT